MTGTLRFGITPCPNDTYMAGAIALGRVSLPEAGVRLELHDIEALNRAALCGEFDILKISCALYGEVSDEYALLGVGAAIAQGYGPLLLARAGLGRDDLTRARIVAPGLHTTGAALFRRYAPDAAPLAYRRYDGIMPALQRGEFDAGVVIHEARLTYHQHGLRPVVDLGAWWSATTGLPVALGCYVMRRTHFARHGAAFESLVRQSLALAAGGDPAIEAYIRRHAQEMDPAVLREYIGLYVNEHTHTLGPAGRAAILALAATGETQCA